MLFTKLAETMNHSHFARLRPDAQKAMIDLFDFESHALIEIFYYARQLKWIPPAASKTAIKQIRRIQDYAHQRCAKG